MTRKIIASMLSGAINPVAPAEQPVQADNVQPHPASQPPRKRSPLAQGGSIGGNSPVGAINKALEAVMTAQGDASELRAQLANGLTIVELDPSLIEGSFVRDRMDGSDADHASLVEAIQARGQQVPILVRPHPEKHGYYQVAYGHRRLRAVTQLGIKVRAVVKDLTDDELVVAQGQENNARLDLTYIEQAMFAARLEQRGFSRATIIEALSIDKSNLAKLISVATKVPHTVIEAVGHAPGIGRGRWLELTELFQVPANIDRAQSIIIDVEFKRAESADRFQRLLTQLSEAGPSTGSPSEVSTSPSGPDAPSSRSADSKSASIFWNDPSGRKLARIDKDHKSVTLKIDRKLAPEFGDYLVSKLNELYASFQMEHQQSSTHD
jgi:ParB family transcriptional regulator, chromosome partitioning protein